MSGLFDRLKEDLEQREKMAGMTPADLLLLPDDERRLVQALARGGDLSLEQLATAVETDSADPADLAGLRDALARLRRKGFARELVVDGREVYRTYFARKRSRGAMDNIWSQLQAKTEDPSASTDPPGARTAGDRAGDG